MSKPARYILTNPGYFILNKGTFVITTGGCRYPAHTFFFSYSIYIGTGGLGFPKIFGRLTAWHRWRSVVELKDFGTRQGRCSWWVSRTLNGLQPPFPMPDTIVITFWRRRKTRFKIRNMWSLEGLHLRACVRVCEKKYHFRASYKADTMLSATAPQINIIYFLSCSPVKSTKMWKFSTTRNGLRKLQIKFW